MKSNTRDSARQLKDNYGRANRTIRLWIAAAILVVATLGRANAQGPQFSHQTIFVTDLDRAANFYEKVLELKRISEPFHDGKHVWFRVSEHGQLHVVSGAKEDIPHDINIHLAFSVPSMDDFTKHLDAMNIKYGNWAQNDKTPQLRPDKVKQIYLQDPDGYWIEINDDKF
jgi:lactoylglutathione lyase